MNYCAANFVAVNNFKSVGQKPHLDCINAPRNKYVSAFLFQSVVISVSYSHAHTQRARAHTHTHTHIHTHNTHTHTNKHVCTHRELMLKMLSFTAKSR